MANKVNLDKVVDEYKAYLSTLGETVLKKNKPNFEDFTKIYYAANALLGLLEIVLSFEENKAKMQAYIEGLGIGNDISNEEADD